MRLRSSSKPHREPESHSTSSEGAGPEPDFIFCPTPPGRANTATSIPAKQNLREIDQGRCLITMEKGPLVAIQECHILPRSTSKKMLKQYSKMWEINEINVDTTANLVSLRADWRAAYDNGCWTLVPSFKTIAKILSCKPRPTFQTPYNGYNKDAKYVFVAFPKLEGKIITRINDTNTEVETYWNNGYDGFPQLSHHSHPFFVVANALPKLAANVLDLTPSQRVLLTELLKIEGLWKSNLGAGEGEASGSRKRRREDDEDDSEGDEEEGSADDEDEGMGKGKGKAEAKGMGIARNELKEMAFRHTSPSARAMDKRKGKPRMQPKVGTKSRLWPASNPNPPQSTPLDRADARHYNGICDTNANISTWINGVIEAGPPERVNEDVIEDDGEVARKPFRGEWQHWFYA